MANITGASLTPIYNRLNGTDNYHPYDAETFADWSLEAGDAVQVSRGTEDFKSPIHSSKLVWKGSPVLSLNSTGKQERESIAKTSKKKYTQSGYGSRNNRISTGRWSHIEETDAYWRAAFSDEVYGLYSRIEITAEYWRSEFDDTKNGLYSRIEQTAAYWRSTLADVENGLYSRVEQTAEYWRASLTDAENGLESLVEQTASYWRASLEDTKNGLYSRIEQTAEYWRASLTDAENGLESLVEQTAAYWRSTLTDTENRLQTSIEQTASGWRVALSGVMSNGKVTAASIATAINDQGQAGVAISGDWIALDGNTKLTGALKITDGNLSVLKTAYFGNNVYITGSNKLILQTSGTPAQNYELTPSIMASMVVKAAVSGNVLKLWTYGEDQSSDPSLTFSKATTLSGTWSGRNFKVTATQNSTLVGTKIGTVYDTLVPTGSVSYSGKNVSRDFIVYSDDGEGDADKELFRDTVTINATSVYNECYNTVKISNAGTQGVIDLGYSGSTTLYAQAKDSNGTYQNISGVTVNAPARPWLFYDDSATAQWTLTPGRKIKLALSQDSEAMGVWKVPSQSSFDTQERTVSLGTGTGSLVITPQSGYDAMTKVTVTRTRYTLSRDNSSYDSHSQTYVWKVTLGTNTTGTSATTFYVYH